SRGRAILTCSSASIAFSPRSVTCDCCTCWRSTSSIWSPTLRIGLSAARGFWKIIEISRPRKSRISFSLAALTSIPENITEPSAMLPARSRIRITAYDVTDLPEPDSPTMPSVSPLATLMLTCCTALTMPRRVVNSTVRSLTSRRGCTVMMPSGKISKTTPCKVERSSLLPHSRDGQSQRQPSRPPLRIDDVAQAVAEQVEAEHRDHQRQPRKQRDPPFARDHEGGAFRDHDAPFRRRRPHAKPDEGQARGVENGVAHGQRHLHDHDRHDVGQD